MCSSSILIVIIFFFVTTTTAASLVDHHHGQGRFQEAFFLMRQASHGTLRKERIQ
jgi:hypothetical protein